MMMRLSLAVVLLIMAIGTAASNNHVCYAKKGKRLITFSNTAEVVKFPCKYNAIKDTICGDWSITVSPGNTLESDRNKKYIIRSLWLAMHNVKTQETWSGRSDLKIARKYLARIEAAPFRKKEGTLETSDVFNYGDVNEDNEVSMTEKNNQFKITFGLYEIDGDWHKSSTFKFECYSNIFVPSNYPAQLCGNGTRREVKALKKTRGGKENLMATLFYNVFSNVDITQTDPECKAAADSLQNQCQTDDERFNVAKVCWPILGKPSHQRCFTSHADNPTAIFRDCVEYMCTASQSACLALGPKLDMCPKLGGVSTLVKQQCFPSLYSE